MNLEGSTETILLVFQIFQILFVLVILGFFLFMFLFIFLFFSKKVNKREHENQFEIDLFSLNYTIEAYKSNIFDPKIKAFQKDFDLNPESRTNAIKLYYEEVNKIIKTTTLEIAKNIPSTTRRRLIDQLGEQALVLTIQSRLRESI